MIKSKQEYSTSSSKSVLFTVELKVVMEWERERNLAFGVEIESGWGNITRGITTLMEQDGSLTQGEESKIITNGEESGIETVGELLKEEWVGIDFISVNITLAEPVETAEVEEDTDISTFGWSKYSSNIVNGRLKEEEDESNPDTDDNIFPETLLTFTGFWPNDISCKR